MTRPKRRVLVWICSVVMGVAGVLMLLGAAFFTLGQKEALASPARPLVQEPCAQYRELSIRVQEPEAFDEALLRQFINWLAANTATFDQAAALDPDMADAASAVQAINSVFSDPARLARVSEEEMNRMEAPLDHACIWGPGRA